MFEIIRETYPEFSYQYILVDGLRHSIFNSFYSGRRSYIINYKNEDEHGVNIKFFYKKSLNKKR